MNINSICVKRPHDGTLWESVGVICTLAGFFMLAIGDSITGFTVSLCGQVAWLVWAKMKGAKGILIVNLVLLIASIIGIWNN